MQNSLYEQYITNTVQYGTLQSLVDFYFAYFT